MCLWLSKAITSNKEVQIIRLRVLVILGSKIEYVLCDLVDSVPEIKFIKEKFDFQSTVSRLTRSSV